MPWPIQARTHKNINMPHCTLWQQQCQRSIEMCQASLAAQTRRERSVNTERSPLYLRRSVLRSTP